MVAIPDSQGKVTRQAPQYAGERAEQDGGLQQPDAKIRREFAQLSRILMDALIWIDAYRSRIGKPERTARHEPIFEQAADQALAQPHLQRFRQPALQHIEDEKKSRDDEEYAELEEKIAQIAARQCIVERLVPAIETNLSVRGGNDDQHDHRHQDSQSFADG